MAMLKQEAIEFLCCRGEESYKYVDLNIGEDELYSNGISEKVNIEKTGAVNLLTEKLDFNELDLCENFNLHYCGESFLMKIDHFLAHIVKGIGHKRNQFLNVQSAIIRNMLDKIFYDIGAKVNRKAEEFNWLCSNDLIRINAGRLSTYKVTYFKDVIVLFDGGCEVNCNGHKNYYIDV